MKHRKKLRRVAILALVLVLLCNTLGVNASTGQEQEPKVIVSDYGNLYSAYAEAKEGDVIGIRGTIVIPTLVNLEKYVVFKRMEAGAKLIFRDDYSSGATGKVTYIEFDGNANEVGGTDSFVVVSGNEIFSMCSFIDCLNQGANGGAVYVGGSVEATISGCNFESNSAYYGSHIYNAGTLNIEGCKFKDGWADESGGAIYNAGTIYINDTEIKENNARIGGGIYNSSFLEINNSLVWSNTVTVQGADIASEGSYTNNTTEEQYNSWLNYYSLYYAGWEVDINTSVGGAGDYLKFLTTTEKPIPPTDPEEPPTPTDPVDPSPTDPTEPVTPTDPTDPAPTDPTTPVDPTDPIDPEDPTNPTDPPTDPTDPPEDPTTSTDPTTPPSTEEPSTEDPKPSTPSDADEGGSGGNTDNSDNSQSSTDNSSSTVSNVDNSSSVSNTDTDNSRSESSRTENSNNSSTVNNYYPQEQAKQDTATGSQNAPQPVNVTVPVNVSVPEQKGENGANTEAGSTTDPANTGSLADKNISIDAKGVDVKLEITGDTYNISISAPEEAKEEQVQAVVTTPTVTAPEAPTEANNKPNWVESVCMLLLAVLVGLEVKDRLRKKPE